MLMRVQHFHSFPGVIYLICSCLPFTSAAVKQRQWLGASNFVSGAPTPRESLGLTAAGGKLFIFGGQGETGEIPPQKYRLSAVKIELHTGLLRS